MTVSELVVGGADYRVTGIGYAPVGVIEPESRSDTATARLRAFLTVGVFANNARLVAPAGDDGWRILGDPTEGALLVAAGKAGIDLDALRAGSPRSANCRSTPPEN
ncbi:hypothetical protein KIV56_09710 [Cryobacterium breve]|uniref:Uncharacterized protein n=1 Tax=Cryobacterium breve TaxID=1259258 RepID=A0ABY7NIT9_9MICO|nr:hypothetical protein KIV56_09710 [Cryobacterium breve]